MVIMDSRLKLIRGVESKVTEKEYIVGLFMAQVSDDRMISLSAIQEGSTY